MSMTISRDLFRKTMIAVLMGSAVLASAPSAEARSRHHVTRHHHIARHVAEPGSGGVSGFLAKFSSGGGDLVSTARSYIGTNPTGRSSLWCGAFMDLVLRRAGHPGGGNLASAYAHYGTRISGPEVGAIAVMARKGGGHVGVVSATSCESYQGPGVMIISGNHNHTTGEGCYPRSRIYAYEMP